MPIEQNRNRSLSVLTESEEQRARKDASLDNLHSLLSEVQYDWRQATEKDANPLDLALPLLDNTSVGLAHRRGEFTQLKERISNGLKSAVNEHYQAFNDSIGSYRSVVQNIAYSQSTISRVRETVNGSIEELKNDDDALNALNENLKSYNDMVVILSAIEDIKQAPADLENAISEKNYAKAQTILHSVHDKADTHSLWKLPALSNLHAYFKTQEDQLFEILVEQLHDILYSKKLFNSYNSVTEFLRQSTSTEYSNIENFLINSISTDISNSTLTSHAKVEEFLKSLNTTEKSVLDSSSGEEQDYNALNAFDEANPFNQLYHILQIIHNLGKFSTAMEIIIQRTTTEVNQLVNRVVEGTKLKHSKIIKGLNSGTSSNNNHNLLRRLTDDSYSSVVLQDLFWNFFRKLLFYEQSVFVITQISTKLEANNPDMLHFGVSNTTSDSLLDLSKLWNLLRVEIKNLLLTYISSDETLSLSNKLTNSLTLKKDDNKASSLFQFYQVDYNKDHTTEMKSVLQDLFPGFINFNDMSKIDSPYIEDNKFLKQSKIIPSSILNMRHILEPFLLFIQGSELLVSHKNEVFFKFFNDFMILEFLPLLEESFLTLYYEEVEDTDPLQVYEPAYDISNIYNASNDNEKPIFKIFIEFKNYLHNVCFILNTSLQFRNEFSRIIFKLIAKFQDKISEIHDDLFNEVISYFEPNKEIIQCLKDHSKSVLQVSAVNINKNELRHSSVYTNYKALQYSLEFILTLLDSKLIKTIDLNKTDLNLTTVEKLRKNWSFFEAVNIKNDVFTEQEDLDLENVNQVILNDDLKKRYDEIIKEYKKLNGVVGATLSKLDTVLQVSV